jgi:SWI/SNF-related matrix-associated actin-dependent regulator 1 of chromatin subfamily A
MDVFFDGERLNVRLNRKIYKKIIHIAKMAAYFEYTHEIGVMSLPPTKRIAKILYNLDLSFDETARIFLNKIASVKTESGTDFSLLEPLQLRPYQEQGIEWMLTHNINFLLGDEMGLGKSVQIATYLFYKQVFPALIVCPASLKLNWEREINTWTKKKCLVLEGLTPYPIEGLLEEFPVVIINYDILGRKNKLEIEYEERRIKEAKKNKLPFKRKVIHATGWVDILKQINFKNIICDECQFIGKMENARTQCVIDVCKGVKDARRIFLSGTPYTSATRQFFPVLHLIDNKTFANRWRYQMTFCDPVKTRFGWEFRGLSNGDQLHNLLKPIMLRRLKKDVYTELPEKIKSIVAMKPDKKLLQKYNNDEIVLLGGKIINEQKTYQDLKRMTYYIKINSCIQWIKDYLEVNNKLVVFTYHRESFERLMKEFDGICVGINGDTPSNKRQAIVDKFQNDNKIEIFNGQIRAAGVGITLTAASAVAFVEFGDTATEHEQAEDRIHRIGQEAEKVIAYYLIAPGTVDEDIIENVRIGYANQKRVLDGEVNAEFINDSPEVFVRGVLNARKAKINPYNSI